MWSSIDGSTTTQSIENYDFQFFRFEIRPKLIYLFRVSFLITLDIYKTAVTYEYRDLEIYFLYDKMHFTCN